MGGIVWNELFPSKFSLFIFLAYMSLFVAQGILVTASQETNNQYNYNTVTVVLLTEALKLITSAALYCRGNTSSSLVKNVVTNYKIMILYLVPASLYCLYNNLTFVNLSAFDPTTYYLMLQFRVVITGILFQVIFKKILSKKQWISLLLLTVGCMIKQINFNVDTPPTTTDAYTKNNSGFDFSFHALFIVVQMVCSCLAGVYNEYILKNQGSEVNIYIQNVFMYLDSIICNAILLLLQGNLFGAFSYDSLKSVFRFNVIIIIINSAAIGICTSFFLKYMNSILKTFASALELLFTAIFCYIFFAIPIYLNTILSIGVVSLAVYLYSQSPVVNVKGNPMSRDDVQDSEKLLDPDDLNEPEEV